MTRKKSNMQDRNADEQEAEDDFLSELVETSDDKFGDDEIINISPLEQDYSVRIASVLERQNRDFGRNVDPSKLMIANRIAGDTPIDFVRDALDMKIDTLEFAGVVSSARAAQAISLATELDKEKGVNNYLNQLGRTFGDRLEKLFGLELTAELDKEKKQAQPADDVMDVFSSRPSPGSLATARLLQRGINGFEERARYIRNSDDIARLVTINLASDLIEKREGDELKRLTLEPDSDLDELTKRAFILIAKNNGMLKDISADEALEKYDRALHSRKPFAIYLAQQFQELGKIKTDFASLEQKIRQGIFDRRKLVLKNNPARNDGEYEQFKRNLLEGEVYEVVDITAKLENDRAYKIVKEKIAEKETEKEKILMAQTLDDLRQWYDIIPDYRAIVFNEVAKKSEIRINKDELDFRAGNAEEYRAKAIELVGKKIKENTVVELAPGLKKGDVLRVVRMSGDFGEGSVYYYGGDAKDIALKSEGELVGVVNDETLVVQFGKGDNVKRFNLHKSEVEQTGKRADNKGDPEKRFLDFCNLFNETEVRLLPDYVNNAKNRARQIIDRDLENLKYNLNEKAGVWYDNKLPTYTMVRIAKALGEKQGYYKSGKAIAERYPIGIIGQINGYEGRGFFNVHILNQDTHATFHFDELEKIERLDYEKQARLRPELEKVLEGAEHEYRQHIRKIETAVRETVDNFSAMNVPDSVIGLFLEQHVDKKFVPEKFRGKNVFEEINKLEKGLNYSESAKRVNQLVRERIGIIPRYLARNITDPKSFAEFREGLLDRIIFGYKLKPVDKEITELNKGEIVISTKEHRDIPAGAIGVYEDTCDNYDDGIQVHYDEYGGSTRHTRKAYHRTLERAFDVENIFGEFLKGARVRIRNDSMYYGQCGGFGILQEDLEGRDEETHVRVKWKDYSNNYRKKDLELEKPEKNLNENDLEKFKAQRATIEELKAGFEPQVREIISEVQKQQQENFVRIYDVARQVAYELDSIGFDAEKIKKYFASNTRVANQLKEPGII